MHQPKLRGNPCIPVTILCFLFMIALISFHAPPTPGAHTMRKIDSIPSHAVHFSFTLPATAKTSAGVYTADSTLIKTLWNGVTFNAGTHQGTWDGTTDDSLLAANGTYYIKVLRNNVTAVWEGTIGNNSDSVTGGTIQRGYDRISCMAVAGQYAYYGKNYSEGNPSQLKFQLSTPRQRIQMQPAGAGTGQATRFVATDGDTVYWAGYDARSTPFYYFIFATRTSNDADVTFSAGRAYKAKLGKTYSAIDTINNANGVVSGLAVQYAGNFLFASHAVLNELHVFNKSTGAMVQNLSFTNPGALAVDSTDHLWMTYTSGGTRRVEKFSIDANGALISTGVVLTGLNDPVAIAAAPDNQTLVIADAGNSQQLKAYNLTTGAASWTFGQAGGYANGPTVSNDKFYFSEARGVFGSFIAFQTDGSFWVGDLGNARAQHYSAARTFLDRIQYIPHFYSSVVDPNNPTRVFADYLEYQVDYSKPIGRNNGSWTLVRNWGNNMTTTHEDHNNRLRCVTTLSNGRTYALALDSITAVTKKWQVLELPPTGNLRYTGVFITYNNAELTQLYPDGSLRKMTRLLTLGGKTTWSKKNLTGFDASNNPLWGADSVVAISPSATFKDPGWFGNVLKVRTGEVSSTGVVIAFDGGNEHAGFDNYHLGGLKPGTNNKWLWRTAMSLPTDYIGPFPPEGSYDVANNVQHSGVAAMVTGRTIFWGYHGEFWKNSQTNKWNIVYDNGLLVNQFGVLGPDVAGKEAPYGMAGNAYGANIVRMGDTVYLYHNDEGHHGGIHRWRITGINNIQQQTIPVSFADTGRGLAVVYYNGSDVNNMKHTASRIDTMVYIDHSTASLADTNNFSVSYTGFIQPLYTENYRIYTATNKGVRLWVGAKLLVDQRNATSAGEYSDTVRMTAGLRYPVRLEIYHTGGASAASLLWSSNSQAKAAIPASQLNPAELPDYSNGYDLLEKLLYHAPLENNIYGWTRNPVVDDDSSQYLQWWHVATGLKGYNKLQPDLYIKYVNKATATATVSRNLGMAANGVPGWELSGTVNYENNAPNEDGANLGPVYKGGSFLEVLDDQGKILVRFFWNSGYNTGITKLYANNQVVANGSNAAMKAIFSLPQSLRISMTGDSVLVQYGPFAPVKVPRFDTAAHWNKPKTFRFFAWTFDFNGARVLDIENMKFRIISPGLENLNTYSKKESREVFTPLPDKAGSLKIYPNPSNGSGFFLQYKEAAAAALTVTVTDLRGGVVLKKTLEPSGNELYSIQFPRKPSPGVYLVIVNGRHAERLAVY